MPQTDYGATPATESTPPNAPGMAIHAGGAFGADMHRFICSVLGHATPVCDQIISTPERLRIHWHWCPRCHEILLKEQFKYPDSTDMMLMADPGLDFAEQSKYLH